MKATNNTPATVNENKGFNVNIKDTVFIGKCHRMDWKAGRMVEIQGYTLEVGQKVLYAEAYGARSWWVCVSEPGGVNGRLQNIVEIGGEHRAMTWDVNHHDQSTADVFGIGLYYDNSGERLTAEEIAKHVRASEIQSRWNDRRKANQEKAEAAERAALLQQWAGILTPLEDVKDWREREKTEKANVINYLKNRFPGVRFTARKSYGSFTISWTDGPSVSAVESACSVWHDHTFNEYEDYNEYTPTQFNRLFGGVTYSIDTNRKNSPEAVQAAREALADLCPELADFIGTGKDLELNDAGQTWLDMTVNRRPNDEQARAFCEAGKYEAGHWYRICPDAVLRVYLEEQDRTQPTTPNDPDQGTRAAADDSDEAPAGGLELITNPAAAGLELVEIAGGVAITGSSRATYKARKSIKAHGAIWNKNKKQWQATDPDGVASLRAWFDPLPAPVSSESDATATNATESTQTAPADKYTTDTAESATEATESGKKYVFGFAQFGELKEKHPDALLLFRCGDFYECYQQDAHTAADLLGIIITDRPDGVTVCAFPHHALDAYLPRIIRAGHRVAICDQLQDDRVTKRLAKRGITATVSAGTAQTATEAAQAAETGEDEGQTTEAPKAQQNAQNGPKTESDGNNNQDPDNDPDNDPDGTDPTPGKGSGAENGTAEPESIRYKASETSPNHQTAEEKPAAALDYEEVTNPIKADDINTPRVLRLSDRRDIVTGCNDEQHAELVAMGGKETAEGVTFRASKQNRHRLHVWQNEQTRKQRAALLGEGWQWATPEHHGKEGDEICTTDGTRGTVTKSSPESICIEFETSDGHTYSVEGHFVRTSPRYRTSETSPKPQTARQNTADRLEIGTRVLCKHRGILGTVDDYGTQGGKLTYIVRFDDPQEGGDGFTFQFEEYNRDGITTNYDPETGRERVGSLEYYDELLAAEWWGNDTRDFDFGNVQLSVDAPEDRSRYYRDKWCVIIYEGDREAVTEWVHIRTLAALLAYYYEHRTTDQDTDQTPAEGSGQAAAAATEEENPRYKESVKSQNFQACEEKQAAEIADRKEQYPDTAHTAWATEYTPDDFRKLTSRYEIADEDRDIMGRRFESREAGTPFGVQVFVSDYAGNEQFALVYILDELEGSVRANVLSLDHLRRTLTKEKGWRSAA